MNKHPEHREHGTDPAGPGPVPDARPVPPPANDLAELKQYVAVHAKAQRIPPAVHADVMARIRTDDPEGPGSWAYEWFRAGEAAEAAGQPLDACRAFTMARFPYVDGPARARALERAGAAFDSWRRDGTPIEPHSVELPGGTVRCWTAGLSAREPRPLLLFTGGIVSTKEQWAPVLTRVARLGMAGVVTELPGAGENTLVYGPESPAMFSRVLDSVADRAQVDRTYAVALSFSGHLALRCALDDGRLRGVATAGAPVRKFFTEALPGGTVPAVTVNTLAHLTRLPPAEVPGRLRDWALSDAELAALDIPVGYLVSRRDEIVPPGEAALLRRRVRRLDVVENDDVHGSPRHAGETPLWMVLSLLRMRGERSARRAVVSALWRTARLRSRWAARTG
ncbi:alpha/beta fold hydrolase [Streptomyces tsukubensis]|uniref:alpha/beta fold hydrolase n=1 Tax=Streptomyces tsukubensis TaxID=83656 RepID=UPI0036A4F030